MQTTIKEKKNISIREFKRALAIQGTIKNIVKDKDGVTIKIEERNWFGHLDKELEQKYTQEELNLALNISGVVERMLLVKAQVPLFDKIELTYRYEV